MNAGSKLVRLAALSAAVLAAWVPTQVSAVTIAFEGGTTSPLDTGSPYTEGEFTLAASVDGQAAVFAAGSGNDLIGGNADGWLGFEESNVITLSVTGGGVFDLTSILLGPSTIASATPIDMTVDGFLSGGGTVSASFEGLTTATTANLGWTNLTSVEFRATDDAGLDDLVASVPEPGTLALLGLGLASLAAAPRRQTA